MPLGNSDLSNSDAAGNRLRTQLVAVMSEASSYNAENESYEQLVAYLDGELDAESSLQVERRLAEDANFRRELQQLQRTWDMLDELPKAEVSEAFTQTTVEMVVLSAEHELQEEGKRVVRRGRLLWAIGGGGLVATACVSFWLMSTYLSRSNERLVRDLPVIEDIELLRVADNMEFVRQLDKSGLFDEEVDDAL